MPSHTVAGAPWRRRHRLVPLLVAVATSACGAAHAATTGPTRDSAPAAAPLTIRVLDPLASGRCPADPIRLTSADTNLARAAVLIAVSGPRDQAGAVVRIVPMDRIDRTYALHRCGALVTDRSLVVNASFPRVTFSAALSYDTFYVARTPRGWSLWDITPGGGD